MQIKENDIGTCGGMQSLVTGEERDSLQLLSHETLRIHTIQSFRYDAMGSWVKEKEASYNRDSLGGKRCSTEYGGERNANGRLELKGM